MKNIVSVIIVLSLLMVPATSFAGTQDTFVPYPYQTEKMYAPNAEIPSSIYVSISLNDTYPDGSPIIASGNIPHTGTIYHRVDGVVIYKIAQFRGNLYYYLW